MMRHLKVLGLSVAAVFALVAVSASAATAAEFHSETEKSIFTTESTSNQVLVTAAGTLSCSGEYWEASATNQAFSEIVATNIVYSGCRVKTIFGNITVKVDFGTNDCHYAFKATGNEVVLDCAKEEGVLILGLGCTIKLPSGQHLKAAIYQNEGSGPVRDLITETSFSNITTVATGSSCTKQGKATNGQLTGSARTKGFVSNGGVPGAQVGIWWSE